MKASKLRHLLIVCLGFFVSSSLGCKSAPKAPVDVKEELRKMVLQELSENESFRNISTRDYAIEVGDPGLIGATMRMKTKFGQARGFEAVKSTEMQYNADMSYITFSGAVADFYFDSTAYVWNPYRQKNLGFQLTIAGHLAFTVELWLDKGTNTVAKYKLVSLDLTYHKVEFPEKFTDKFLLTARSSFKEAARDLYENQFLRKELPPILDHVLRSRKYHVPTD